MELSWFSLAAGSLAISYIIVTIIYAIYIPQMGCSDTPEERHRFNALLAGGAFSLGALGAFGLGIWNHKGTK